MSDVVSGLLGRAAVAFEQREEEDALLRLLEAWRETRSERLAALVEQLSARITARLPPLPCNPWSSIMDLHRPGDLARMLDDFRAIVSRGHLDDTSNRLRGWRRWPADPRLIPAVVASSRLPIAQAPGVLHALHDLLVHLRDAQCLQALRELHADLPPEHPYVEELRQTLTRVGFPLEPEELTRCDALEEAIHEREATEARSAATREALLARVHSNPDDDGARMVLADHLLELGDPRGELIMLQCTPAYDEARLNELLGKHRARWEGPLGPAVALGSVRFERGFPEAVRMAADSPHRLPSPPGPEWSTVRDIDWSWMHLPEAADWLTHPHLRGVTRLRRVSSTLAQRLGANSLPVRRLELGSLATTAKAPDVFASLSALPHLTWVQVQDALPVDVALCADSPLGSSLERFEASMSGAWSLVATPSKKVSVEATLVSELHVDALAAAIRGAAGFGTRALRIRTRRRLDTSDANQLKEAAAAYARIDWARGV